MAPNPKKTSSSFGFVSGGTLNPSSFDTSGNDDDQTLDNQDNVDVSDMELNSDDDLLSNIINYDEYIVDDDDEMDYESTNQYNTDKFGKSSQFRNKGGNRYTQYGSQTKSDADMPLNEDHIQKIYGKGLNMLKKMGYKGGGLGRDGKGLTKPLLFTTNANDNFTYKIEKSEPQQSPVTSDSLPKNVHWLTQLRNKYNELLNKNEMIKRKKKELEMNNLQLKEELKLLKQQIQSKVKQLENIKSLRPSIVLNYNEYLVLLNDPILENYVQKGNKSDDNNTNNTMLSKQIDIIVQKLIALLNLINQMQINNKLYKSVIILTFKKIFTSNFYYDLSNYHKFFESLPTINNYYNNYYNDDRGCLTKVFNFYIINPLLRYFGDEWDVANIDEGINIYQQVHNYLYQFYNSDPMDQDGNFSNDFVNISSNSGEDFGHNQASLNDRNNGLVLLLKLILNRLTNYIENAKLDNLYNSHIIIFSWLQFLNDTHIQSLVNTFLDSLFKKEDHLIPNYELENTSYDEDSNKIKIYENIFNNWSKLMMDKNQFGDRIYSKLHNQLSSINFKFHIENKDKLKDLMGSVLLWDKFIDNDNMVTLLSNTLLPKFKKHITSSIESISDMYNALGDNKEAYETVELRTKLVEKVEDVHSNYTYVKSLLPKYVINNRDVQVNHFKVVLKSIESFLNSINTNNIS